MAEKKKVIAIVGPTASGKTSIGVKLAKEFNGEIVSADSRQVYRGLDLGTGKDLIEYDGVKYHMIDIAEPEEKMTLFDYLPLARAAIADIHSRGKLPIIVGGTGLYIQGLVEGFGLRQNSELRIQNSVGYKREELDDKTVKELNDILDTTDPDKILTVDRKNAHRMIRAIEMAQEGLTPVKVKPDFEVLQIGIDIPRNELHERIDKRVEERFDVGMLEEVSGLLNRGVSPEWLIGLGLEYREMTEFLQKIAKLLNCHIADLPTENNTTIQQYNNEFNLMKQQLKWRTHQFARRQITWFRRFPEVNWLSDFSKMKRFVKIYIEH